MAWTTLSNGTLADADEPQNNFNLLFRHLGSDTTSAQTTSSSFTKIGEVAVGAGIVNESITTLFTLRGRGRAGAEAYFELRIGTSGAETNKYDLGGDYFFQEVDSTNLSSQTTTFFYNYTPTAGEKSTGFNVQIYAKNANSGDTVDCYNVIVLGG